MTVNVKSIKVFSGCGGILAPLSVDKIATAIRKVTEKMELYDPYEFGGTTSAAFRERIIREYNEEHQKDCPNCGLPLRYTEPDAAECDNGKQTFNFPNKGKSLCYVSEEGVAEFVGRKIGNGFANRTGDHYHLGEVRGRTLYYGTNPSRRFYSGHKGSVGIVLGSNDAEVPEGWTGHVAYLSELFYVNEPTGEICVSRNILNELLPKSKSDSGHGGPRIVHELRSEWLMFISNLLAKKLNPSDFLSGRLRPKVARDWFVANVPGAPKSVKEYQRDLRDFRYLDTEKKKADKREEFIILLLRTAADPKRSEKERMGIAKVIPELVIYLKQKAEKNPGRPINITRTAWQYCKDGTKEYIAITDIEEFFEKLDKPVDEEAA